MAKPLSSFSGSTFSFRKLLLILRVDLGIFLLCSHRNQCIMLLLCCHQCISLWATWVQRLCLSKLLFPPPSTARNILKSTSMWKLPFVAWLLIGGGFDAGLLVGWRGTEKGVSPTDPSGLILPLLIWHAPETKLEFCIYFPLWGLEPLLSTEFLLCTFWLISDEPSFLMHFWPLLRS